MRNPVRLLLLLPLVSLIAGCGALPAGPRQAPARWAGDETLTLLITELRMHLREDPYRFPRPVSADGRSVFDVILWKLDRLQRQRDLPPERWENVDDVIEFARARTLERLRRYEAARRAYAHVADSGSILSDLAVEGEQAMAAFAAQTGAMPEAAQTRLGWIDARIDAWRSLAAHYRGTPRSALAWEEVEAWQTLRVDHLAREGDAERAVQACRQLLEHNRDSKRYAQHLIRLGDLYADAARRERLQRRAVRPAAGQDDYERLLESAFAAYEMAGEGRGEDQRREAETRIEALMAFHEGSAAHAP